jgi:hypothetical protein
MKLKQLSIIISLTISVYSLAASAIENEKEETPKTEDRLALKTSFIKGNKELPQVLYIVPWQALKKTKKTPKDIVLHSLYGDVFQPVLPEDLTYGDESSN